MTRDSRYDVLFEPVQIGPVIAKNRFYQVPYCNGMGFNWPQTHAKMREAKAEGGWAVICTEECMIHPTSDYTPEPQARLWDVNVSSWENDSQTSRFSDEGFQEKYVAFVKQMTTKPVVGVGRFTSPDAMVSQINRGVLDMIGAARPSIADPFLPLKIEQGRIDEIRECIGCNICYTGDSTGTPRRNTRSAAASRSNRNYRVSASGHACAITAHMKSNQCITWMFTSTT
jgi:2,4-dienoyl-CoA reductase-like NADH-dependent reductase (Old Yellow Enzyme family)